MAVQQNKKSRARRDSRRTHDALVKPTLSVDATSGETHRRHHVTADGFYRGKRVIAEDDHGAPIYEDLAPTPAFYSLSHEILRKLASTPPK